MISSMKYGMYLRNKIIPENAMNIEARRKH